MMKRVYYTCCLWEVTLYNFLVLQQVCAFISPHNTRFAITSNYDGVTIITPGEEGNFILNHHHNCIDPLRTIPKTRKHPLLSRLFMALDEEDEIHNSEINKSEDGNNNNNNNNNRHNKNYVSAEMLEEIKRNADIVSVVEAHDLPGFHRQSDSRAVALCPFHDDTNPSMNIDNNRGLYKCFACGAGGDVFQFIREYRHITTGQAKLSYPQAIQVVIDEYLPKHLAQDISKLTKPTTKYQTQNMQLQNKQRERIKLANAAACDFYAKALVTSPLAGASRNHLRLRGIRPSTVTTFALGYAPDVYFSKTKPKKALWGEGSLVEKLKQLKFTPQEIIDAGLATRLQKKKNNNFTNNNNNNNNNGNEKNNYRNIQNKNGENEKSFVKDSDDSTKNDTLDADYTTLMDRFRGRIMIPIFDKSGTYIVAFGGRHIDNSVSSQSQKKKKQDDEQQRPNDDKNTKTKSNYVAAKYINSPESLLFRKKNTLFGLHNAKMAMKETVNSYVENDSHNYSEMNPSSATTQKQPLVIVEGYFDAITLYATGIREVVASMGTALTLEQLESAAECATSYGDGRVILCLDNDDAGINAVDRVCSGNLLSKVLDKFHVQFLVASLPDGIKDPAEYIETKGGVSATNSSVEFRANILETSIDWTDWYIHHLTKSYNVDESTKHNNNGKGSFTDICDRISTFLASFSNSADRTRRAYEAAGILASALSSSSQTQSSLSTLQIQLESDLLDMSSRKATAREALSRRVEKINDISSSTSEKVSKMLKGESFSNELDKHSIRKTNQQQLNDKKRYSNKQSTKINDPPLNNGYSYEWDGTSYRTDKSTRNRNRNRNTYPKKQPDKPILPHFSGFHFSNPDDAEWLGVSGNNKQSKQSLLLGQLPKELYKNGAYSSWKSNEAVYFNSNEYIGGKFLNKPTLKEHMTGEDSPKTVGLDVSGLLDRSSSNQILVAERQLLRSLVAFPPARVAMKTAMARNFGSHSLNFDWSNQQREWLFKCLVEYPGFSPLPKNIQENATSVELRDYLSIRPDVPIDAFGKKSQKIDVLSSSIEIDATNNTMVQPNATKIEEASGLIGVLDEFFVSNNDDIFYTSNDTEVRNKKIEFTVQETVATMLKANAIKRLSNLKNHWKLAYLAFLNKKKEQTCETTILSLSDQDKNVFEKYFEMDINDLSLCCMALANDTNEAMKAAHELNESAKRIGRRMLDYCSSSEFEGRLTSRKREELIKEMNQFIDSLPEDAYMPTSPGSDGDYVFGSDSFDREIGASYGYKEPTHPVTEYDPDPSSVYDERFVNYINSLPDNDLETDFLDDDGHDEDGVIETRDDGRELDRNTIQEMDFLAESKHDVDSDDIEPSNYDNIFQ